MAFPGFLAFVRGLLLSVTMPDSLAPARPSPEVVQDILCFLAARIVELEEEAAIADGEDREHREAELKMTSRLVDLVLYLLHDFGPDDVGKSRSGPGLGVTPEREIPVAWIAETPP